MRIGFDGTIWGGEERGVAAATRRLFVCLAKSSEGHELTAFIPDGIKLPQAGILQGSGIRMVKCRRINRLTRVPFQQFVLPRLARRHRVEVLYSPCYTAPLFCDMPSVISVHDLIAWKRPDLCPWLNVLHFRTLVGISVRRARCVTVPTEAVKRDLVRILKVPERKVHVVPWGVDAEIHAMNHGDACALVRRRFGIDQPFILFVGCLEPKKNLATAVQAAKRIGVRLVVTGPHGWGERTVRGLIRRSDSDEVRAVGYVVASELSALYAAATVLVFPSHIEGFGLPAIEAMACGTPVVASDIPALREVCGGAAIHVPVRDADSLARTLLRVVESRELQTRMARRGLDRAREFTWDRSIDRFLAVLRLAVE